MKIISPNQLYTYNENFVLQIIEKNRKAIIKFLNGSGETELMAIANRQPSGIHLQKIGWTIDEAKLALLYTLLCKNAYINSPSITMSGFIKHFYGSSAVSVKIVWKGSITALVYLFNTLIARKAIPPTNKPYKLISEHFLNKNCEHLYAGNLRVLNMKGVNNMVEENITRIINSVTQ